MRDKSKKHTSKSGLSKRAVFYCLVVLATFLVGMGPIVFNFIIDPYEMNAFVKTGLVKEKISEKAHYPLWKVTHFPYDTSEVVILGDSRARAMKNKYWHELGLSKTYNFAYGGTTMLEIYDTFHFVKNSKNLKTLVVGIQLRSFDPDHKGRMNRVPEAIRLYDNPLQYYSNWFVSGIGLKLLDKAYSAELQWLAELNFDVIPKVYAGDAAALGSEKVVERVRKKVPGKLIDLLEPVACKSCLLPQDIPAQQHPSSVLVGDYYFASDLGIWRGLWPRIIVDRTLPHKYSKQIVNNAKSDWRSFHFSETFWSYLVEISDWCNARDIKLVFVIPPTIVEMQNRLVEFGHGTLNHEFREGLAELGEVVDFDFDNPVTRDLGRFKDAYHFNSKTSKLIVGEITQLVSQDEAVVSLARKRRQDIICPLLEQDVTAKYYNGSMEVLEGKSCRIWRTSHE
ncbi:MAG: hypothetical protein JKY45_02045 [Emcibacter sp.]|nr:hypothetical protein [Emcibacter sp.]